MQTSRFQLGLIATLAVGLGFSLSSSEAIGYPAGPSVSGGSNPVISVGGTLNGLEEDNPLTAPPDKALIITDVVLSAMDSTHDCRGSVRVDLSDEDSTIARLSVGLGLPTYSYANYDPVSTVRFESGLRIEPNQPFKIKAAERLTWSCSGSGMEVHYTISGYYAQP